MSWSLPFPASPLQIEILNQTDSWQRYVPPLVGLLGSILVAVVALYSVRKSNRTNERAIEAADTRERERWLIDSDRERAKWHRDNLLRICSEAVRVSREIGRCYNQAAGVSLKLLNPDDFDEAFWRHMDAAQGAIDKVAPLSYDMTLLGESGLYGKFQEVRQVGEFVGPAFVQYHEYLVANLSRIRLGKQGEDGIGAAELYGSLAYRRYNKAVNHLNRTQLDFQLAARKVISPHSLPEGDLPSLLDYDLPPMPPGMSQNPFRRPSSLDWNAGDTADTPNSPVAQTD